MDASVDLDQPDASDASDRLEGSDASAEPDAWAESMPDAAAEVRTTVFEVWRDLQDAIRQSPDHLSAEAERLVEVGDAAAIYAFVRDRIATYPGEEDRFGYDDAMRWGIRGTLRGGAGTPREKAELLADLLSRAGFSTRLMTGPLDEAAVDVRDVLLRPVELPFAPAIGQAEIDDLWKQLGASPAGEALTEVPLDGLTALVAARDAELVDQNFDRALPFSFSAGDVPIVEVTLNGEPTLLNPIVPGGVMGQSYLRSVRELTDTVSPPTIEVSLAVASTHDLRSPITLVSKEWNAEDLLGRQVGVGFAPQGDITTYLGRQLNEHRSLGAVLSVQGPRLSEQERLDLSASGSVVTSLGQILGETSGGLEVDGSPVSTQDNASPSRVAEITGQLFPGAYPRVRVQFQARDASGTPVEGLQPRQLSVLQDGERVPFVLEQNTPQPPRVLILLDGSGSVPDEFLGDGAVAFGSQLVAEVQATHPEAEFRVAMAYTPGARYQGDWSSDPDAIAAQLGGAGVSSDLWSALAQAMDSGASVIAFVSDADASDELTASRQAKIAGAGIPVVAIGVGTVDQANLDQMAALSGGVATAAAMRSEAVAAVSSFIGARTPAVYELVFDGTAAGEGKRSVAIESGDASLTLSYLPPPADASVEARRYAGLYVTVRVGDREVVRTLAGLSFDTLDDSDAAARVTPELLTEVQLAFFDNVVLSFEGPAPTLSQALDDYISTKLQVQPALEAIEQADEVALREAYGRGFDTWSSEAFTLHGPHGPRVADSVLVYETGLQVLLVAQQARPGIGIIRRTDILPLGGWSAASDDPELSWRRVLRHTAALALAETSLHEVSTATLLDGVELKAVTGASVGTAFPSLDASARERWLQAARDYRTARHTLVVPSEGDPVAFWAVDEDTGAVLGVIEDGSGGARTIHALAEQIELTMKLLKIVSFVASARRAGLPVSAWINIQKVHLELLGQAATAFTLGIDLEYTGPIPTPDIDAALTGFACASGKAVVGRFVPIYGQLGQLDAMHELLVGAELLPCKRDPAP